VNNRRTLIIAASVLAVFAVLSFAVLGLSSRQAPAIPSRAVVYALHPIAPHTKLSQAMFAVAQRPANQVDPSAIPSVDSVDGMVSQREIVANVPVTTADVAPAASLGLAVSLRQGMRAVAIPVDSVKDVSDLLHPGDRVDVIAAPPREGNVVTAYTIMRDITVLSIGPTFIETPAPAPSGAPQAPPVQARTVTLEVTPAQADLLTLADLNATLRLALRPPNEQRPAARPVDPGVPVINGDQVAGAGR
jgi:pilus assembly protein CpaB